MTLEVKKRLFDARNACRAILDFTRSKRFSDYERDHLLRSAVERQLEIVGEALGQAARADASLLGRVPELPRIVGLRNRIIHGYDSVDDEIVWDIVQTKVAPLLAQTDALLDAEDERDE